MVLAAKPWRVIITRPSLQAELWAQELIPHGFAVDTISMLEISPVNSPEHIQAIKNKIMNLDLYQKVIFVSQNAVRYGMEWIENYWPQMPTGIDFFAVGATTAKHLMGYGVAVQNLAVSDQGSMTSEDLLCAPSLQQVAQDKILIMRGYGGRGHLAEELRVRGAQVEYCELYERLVPVTAAVKLNELLKDAEAWQQYQNIITVHSGESLDNLVVLMAGLKESANIKQVLLFATPLIVPSERVALAAQAAGFVNVMQAKNATDAAMTSSLLDYCRADCAPE